jgi:hypothetical protein
VIVTGTYTFYKPPLEMPCGGNFWTSVAKSAGTAFANPAASGNENFLPQETQHGSLAFLLQLYELAGCGF